MMTVLHALQEKFQAYLLSSTESIAEEVKGTARVSVTTRLEIYHHAYSARLIDSLATTYPVLYAYLGSEDFEALARAYIKYYPSTFRSIRWFGDRLANFLLEDAAYCDDTYLAELAKVEWAMTLVFDAPDSPVVTLEAMQHIPPDAWSTMVLTGHASVHCIPLAWNVVDIWKAVTFDEDVPEPVESESVQHWIFWRKELVNQYCLLDEDGAWAIEAALKGSTFGSLCAGLCQWHDESQAPLRAAGLLKSWISEGLVEKLSCSC